MKTLTLTAEQVKSLKNIAAERGMRVLVTRTQVGIGASGVAAFNVVYTAHATRPWQLRGESDRPLKEAMKAVIG